VTPSIPVINGSSVNPNSSILIDSSNSSGDSRASSPKGSPALNLASLPYATREDMQNLDGKHWELHRRLDAHAELHDEFATKKYVTALVSENNAVFNGRLENHEKSLGEFVVKEDLEKFKLEASNLIIQGRSRSYSNDIRMLTSEIQRLNSEIENLRTKPVQSTDVSDV
ncbi:MAG: hypothetical protein JSS09_00415, partial [Verrucomicrobia bacterium]|nr:hypothetical protein [Verrucomicrobiota bacterium]